MPRPALAIALLALLPAVPSARPVEAAEDHVFRHENVMGTSLELVVRADDPAAATRAEARVLAEVDRLSRVFSGYDPSSEFRRWMDVPAGPVAVSPELFEVLRRADEARDRSGGAFDPRVEVLSRLWSRSAKLGRTPTEAERAGALARMAAPAWRLDPDRRTAERTSDCPVSLDAIAKGFIVGRAGDMAMREPGVLGVLLNVGGDLRVLGRDPRMVGIAAPRGDSENAEPVARIAVRDRSVATSGASQRGWRVGGRWYSHIFDPRTGRPVEAVVAATVVAEDASVADALATTLNVLPPERGLELARSTPGVECLIVAEDGRQWPSRGWGRMEAPLPIPLAAREPAAREPRPGPAGAGWPAGRELAVKFEVGPAGGDQRRYRRPYLAVWVEDKDGVAVRTLALWLQVQPPGPRWHPDLKKWYQNDQLRKLADDKDLIATVARPTRPPGKYEVVWDGKDDDGKPVGAGPYTLNIEAAREHGTYQLIRKPLTIGEEPFDEELKGNVEIKSASVALRRKAGQ